MGLGHQTLCLADGVDPVQRFRIVGLAHEHQVVVVAEDIPNLVDAAPDHLNLMLQMLPLGRPRRNPRAGLCGCASRSKLDQGYELHHGPTTSDPYQPVSLSPREIIRCGRRATKALLTIGADRVSLYGGGSRGDWHRRGRRAESAGSRPAHATGRHQWLRAAPEFQRAVTGAARTGVRADPREV